MGNLYRPAQNEIFGPWLLGTTELEELDKIVEFIDLSIEKSTEEEITDLAKLEVEKSEYPDIETAKKKIKEYRFSSKGNIKKVILISSDEARLTDKTILGILKDPKAKNLKPKEISISIENRHSNQFNFKIERYFNGSVKYDLRCYDQNCEEDIKYKLDSWLEKHKPNKAKQFWSNFSFPISMVCLLITFFSLSQIYYNESPDFRSEYINEINKLISTGITTENETKALELLLKYETNFMPDSFKPITKVNHTTVKFISLSFFIFLLSIFKPKTTIGIGSHKSLLSFYKIYTKVVIVSLPTIFILPPLIDWIKSLIGLYL